MVYEKQALVAAKLREAHKLLLDAQDIAWNYGTVGTHDKIFAAQVKTRKVLDLVVATPTESL